MPPTVSADAPAARRTWPTTVILVIFAVLLMLYDGFVAVFSAAAFFGETASRGDDIKAAMTCLTALPAFAAMVWCGWQRGSRLGLLLIGPPAALMAYLGLKLLTITSFSSRDPNPSRTPRPADLFGDLTFFNWAAVVVFVAAAVATLALQRRTAATLP